MKLTREDVVRGLARLWRALFCRFGRCMRCTTRWDDGAVWGECIDCGKRHGVVTREALRRYIDRQLDTRALAQAREGKGRT